MLRLVFVNNLVNIFSKNVWNNILIVNAVSTRKLSTNTWHEHDIQCPVNVAGLIIGVHRNDEDLGGQMPVLTETGQRFNKKIGNGLLLMLHHAKPIPKLGDVRILYGLDPVFHAIAVVGLGDQCLGYNKKEHLDERKEAIRIGVGAGVRALQKLKIRKVYVDSCGHAESAAEGACLGSWVYQEMRCSKDEDRVIVPVVELFDSCEWAGWQIGLHKAAAQNLARHLMETPANFLSPSGFAQNAVEILSKQAINVEIRMHNWMKLRNINAFLAVGMGSCEQPVFMEILYEGCDPDICPVVLIGKGMTFDSGGLCLKKKMEMTHMRGEMAGAATVVAAFRAIASLQLPINVRGLIPLCANMPGATALKPGDTVKAMNGKTILVENTDHAEGLLMLADALTYAQLFNPKCIVDVATLTHGATYAFGSGASLVYSNSDSLYETMRIASAHTGDRIWRLPLWQYFSDYAINTRTSDMTNLANINTGGGPGRAAAFLREFVTKDMDWLHVDSFNVMLADEGEFTYLRKGMAGRPTRTLVEFLAQLCCKTKEKSTEEKTKNI